MDDPIAQFIDWYKTRPIITKIFITTSTVLSFLVLISKITVLQMFYTFQYGFVKMQIWRTITSIFYLGQFSFSFLFQIYLAQIVIFNCQTQIFQKQNRGSFWMCLIYNYFFTLLISSLYDIYFLYIPFLFSLLYVLSQVKPHGQTILILNIKIQNSYVHWVFLGFYVLMKHSFIAILFGLISGYIYYLFKTTIYQKYNIDFLPNLGLIQRLADLYTRNQRVAYNPFRQENEQ